MRIVIAGKETALIKNIRDYLTPAGNQIVGEAEDGITALKLVRTMQPELVILESNLSGMSGLEIARIIGESRLAPVIVIASYGERKLINERGDWPFPILPKPLEVNTLTSVIEYVVNSFQKILSLEGEVKKLQKNLATRKIVEKAKGLLMTQQGLSEEEAYKKMQQLSMKKRKSMKKIAEAIIMAYDIKV